MNRLKRSTHHYCSKCKENLSEYKQEKCNKCKCSLKPIGSVIYSNGSIVLPVIH